MINHQARHVGVLAPPASGEQTEVLLAWKQVKIERLVSGGAIKGSVKGISASIARFDINDKISPAGSLLAGVPLRG